MPAAAATGAIDGIVAADPLTGPCAVVAVAEVDTMDDLGRLAVSQVQIVQGITQTITLAMVNL